MAGVVATQIKAKIQKEGEEEAKVSLCTIFKYYKCRTKSNRRVGLKLF